MAPITVFIYSHICWCLEFVLWQLIFQCVVSHRSRNKWWTQQRVFFLWKLNHFRANHRILQMLYKSVLQSVLPSGLICSLGNKGVQDQAKLRRNIKTASKITGVDQVSVAQLYNDLIFKIGSSDP